MVSHVHLHSYPVLLEGQLKKTLQKRKLPRNLLLRFLTFEEVIQLKILNIQTIYTSQLIQRRNTSTHYIRLPLSELNVK